MSLLRLPGKMPHQLKLARMQEVIDALELNKCLDTSELLTVVKLLSLVCIETSSMNDVFVTLLRFLRL